MCVCTEYSPRPPGPPDPHRLGETWLDPFHRFFRVAKPLTSRRLTRPDWSLSASASRNLRVHAVPWPRTRMRRGPVDELADERPFHCGLASAIISRCSAG